MTASTEEAPASRPARAPRRSPQDLTITFLDEANVRARVESAGEPEWLLADRLAAQALVDALPVESNPLYTTYLDLRAAELSGVRPYQAVAASSPSDEAADPADDTAALIELREDGAPTRRLSEAARAAGVTLTTFGELLARDPERLRRHLDGGGQVPVDEKLAQAIRAHWNQGVLLEVPAGVRLERPVVVRWAVGEPDRAVVGRLVIALGADAQASVVEEIVPSAPRPAGVGQALFAATTEVTLARGANLAMASVQELGLNTVVLQNRDAVIGDGANLRWALAQLGGPLVRSRVDNRLVGDGSTVEQVEIVFGSGSQLFDLSSYTRHIGRDTTGNLLSKGVLLDGARSFMKGLITIEKTAIGTDSFLGEYGMNLSKQARAVAIPSLEIDQPDCRRAAHSSSVGPIDESQVFYLESRGIPRDEARKFIVLGYLEPVVARVPLSEEQDRLRALLDEKWTASVRPAAA
jgi:Fe-S cluster assembly scaffold protein SufB